MGASVRQLLLAVALVSFSAASSLAADPARTVRVALLDMTSVVSPGAGIGMMGAGPGGGWGGGGAYGSGMMGGAGGLFGPGMMGGGMMGRGMMSIRADRDSITAGTVDFDVTNWSRSVIHELLVVPVDSADAPLPYDYGAWRVAEDQIKISGETGELAPNASKTLEVTLAAGVYELICNVPGHYAAGMALSFKVTP
jgi:uncharacterized cupredoxin-like copper-binding protein